MIDANLGWHQFCIDLVINKQINVMQKRCHDIMASFGWRLILGLIMRLDGLATWTTTSAYHRGKSQARPSMDYSARYRDRACRLHYRTDHLRGDGGEPVWIPFAFGGMIYGWPRCRRVLHTEPDWLFGAGAFGHRGSLYVGLVICGT